MSRHIRLITIFIFLTPVFLQAQEIRVKASFDTSAILIGDQVYFTLECRQPANRVVAFPGWSDTLTRGVEILRSVPADTLSKSEEDIIIKKKYLVTAFDTGVYEIPPSAFTWEENGSFQIMYSDEVYLQVGRADIIPSDSTEIFDIKAPYRAPVTFTELFPWLVVILLLAVAVWGVYWYLQARRKGKNAFIMAKPAEPPWQTAFRELEILKEEKLWQQGKTKEYYTRLTDIIRRYIYGMYDIQSLERTSFETLELLRSGHYVPEALMQRLKYVLHTSDMVKFAKAEPRPSENDQVFREAYDFVLETHRYRKQREEEANASEGEEDLDQQEEGGAV